MSKLGIGDKIKCIDSSIQPHMVEEVQKDFEMWVRQGAIYTVRGFNENDGIVLGVLLEEIYNFPKYFKLLGRSQEPAFADFRFRKQEIQTKKEEVTNVAEVEI